MTTRWRRWVPMVAGLGVVASVVLARAGWPDPFDRVRAATFDVMQTLQPWTPATSPVLVVDIDDASLARLGQWPWPRSMIATMVTRLQDAGAAAIVFDAVFAEPDRTSPATLARDWTARFGWTPPTAHLPDFDADLAAAFGRGRVVAGFGLVGASNGDAPTLHASFATIGGDPAATVTDFKGAVPNLPILDQAAAGGGSFSLAGGADQVVRTLPLLVALNGALVPSLTLEALRVAADEDTIGIRSERNGGPDGPVTGYTVKIGDWQMPLERDGTLRLHHSPPGAHPGLPAWKVAGPTPEGLESVKGRIVLIGTSAVGLADLRATPLNPLEPGVNLHARAIEQVVAQHFLARPTWAPGAEILTAALLSVLLTLAATLAPLRYAAAAGVVLGTGVAGGVWLLFTRAGLLFDPTLIVPTMLASTVATSLARYVVAGRDAMKLRAAFKHYLSPDLVDVLARDPARLVLGGEARNMTFLFTDLQGFTALMESADPAAAVTLLNEYLDGLCAVAIDHGGTLDKIVGDALHVIFNAPLDQPDHAARAVHCALAMDAFAQEFAAERQRRGLAFGVTRIGVNTGTAVVGNFGGRRRFDYTAHGDAINTAARLEAANKALGTRICVAASTVAQVTDVTFLPIGTLALKGKTQGVDVFLPCAVADWQADYREAFARLAEGDETAGLAILALQARAPDDPVLALHARRIRAGERGLRMAA